MANRRGRPKKKQLTIKSRETSLTLGTIAIILSGLIALSFFVESSGFLVFKQFLGLSAIFASLFLLNLSLRYFGVDTRFNAKSSLFLQFFLVFLVAGLLSAVNYNSSVSTDSENLDAEYYEAECPSLEGLDPRVRCLADQAIGSDDD